MRPPERKVKWVKWNDAFQRAIDEMHAQGEPVPVPCIHTPSGVVSLYENASPSDVFNMWAGHTNFPISPFVAETIAAEPGVEVLDVLSRYCFRIVVGRCFSEAAVMRGVELSLGRASEGVQKCVDFLLQNVQNNWVFAVGANGQCEYFEGPVAQLQQAIAGLDGMRHVFTSWGSANGEVNF